LKSRGRIVGLDMLGNEVGHSFTDPEIYYKPQTQYAMRDKDPNDSSRGIAAGINEASAEYREYTLYHLMKRTFKTYTSKDQQNHHRLLV
jgi:hypothetical protein